MPPVLKAVHERVDLVFVSNGTPHADKFVANIQKQGLVALRAGQPGSTFEDLLAVFRREMATFAHATVFTGPSAQRTLEPGQPIYLTARADRTK